MTMPPLILLIAVSSWLQGACLVQGARVHSLLVKADRHKSLQARTVDTLASTASLGDRSSFRASSDQDVSTAKGVKLRPLTQTYGGYQVYGSVVSAEVSMDGQFTGHMTGEVVLDLQNDIPDPEACQRDIRDIIDVALEAEGLAKDDSRVQDKDGRRIAFLQEDGGKGVMAYTVDFFVDEIIKRPFYIIDACDDTIYVTFNMIQNATMSRHRIEKRQDEEECGECEPSVPGYGGNRKAGRTTYNVAPYCLNVFQNGSTCTMESTYVKVINNRGSTSRNINTVISFPCSSGYIDPYGNKNWAYGVANDAMYFGHITGEFYVKKYNFRALSWVPNLVIHYGSNYENAFWTGTNMYFGDGAFTRFPYVCEDVIAHELAHGITSKNSKLEYRDRSGGINEAFSDISGEVVEHYVYGGANDWKFGSGVTKFRPAIRYFSDPTNDGRSIKHSRDYYDGLDVHYSSGVYNHAFYRMVQVHGMDIYDVYKCFLDANRSGWGTTTGYDAGACHVMRACYANGYNTDHVSSAFSNVGVSTSGCSLSLHAATVFSGQTRSDILVSSTTNPIMEISLDKGTSTITASAQDGSPITLHLAADEEAKTVVDEQAGRLEVESSEDDQVLYVKLTSQNRSQVKVVLRIR